MGRARFARGGLASSVGVAVVGRTLGPRTGMGRTPGRSGSGCATRRVPDVGRATCPGDPERRPDVGLAGARLTARVRARALVGCAGRRRRTIGGPRAVWPRPLLGCTASA